MTVSSSTMAYMSALSLVPSGELPLCICRVNKQAGQLYHNASAGCQLLIVITYPTALLSIEMSLLSTANSKLRTLL